MNDTIEVEVDGVIDDDTSGRAPAWGLPVAVAIVSALALVVVIRAVLPGVLGAHGQSGARHAVPKRHTSLAGVEDARIAGARAALAAWGRFAVSGDLGKVAGVFVPDGPQYRQLAGDAGIPRLVSGIARPYEVSLSDVHLGEAPPGEAVVIGTVVWTRPGEPDQRYAWELELRSADGNAWRLWTVRDAASGGKPDA